MSGKAKFSKDVQTLIQTESGIGYEPPKSDLGYKLAQCVDKTEIPTAIIECFEKAYKAAN